MLAIEKADVSNELSIGTFTLIAVVASDIGMRSIQNAPEIMIENQKKLVNCCGHIITCARKKRSSMPLRHCSVRVASNASQ
jgi:hypothetical protein